VIHDPRWIGEPTVAEHFTWPNATYRDLEDRYAEIYKTGILIVLQ
jgi:hypothetical protein